MLAMKGLYPHEELAQLPAEVALGEVVALTVPIVTDARAMTAPVAAVTTPETVAVGVGVNTTSYALTPATRLTLSDRGSKPGALVLIVALPTGRFRSSNRPSVPVVDVALPIVTDAPSMTAPAAALTTPDTVAVAVGPSGSPPPHAAASIDATKAIVSVGTDVENRMRPLRRVVRSRNARRARVMTGALPVCRA